MERWLPVVGWARLYEVSDLGNVRSLPRPTARGVRGGNMLTPWDNGCGYPFVTLSRDGKPVKVAVHTLVLTAHDRPREAHEEARHGPGGKWDCRLVNLCWGSRVENIHDRVRDGQDNGGERNEQAVLTAAATVDIKRRVAGGERQSALAAEYGVSRSAVWMLVHGHTWAA